jgi:hypothetical protein
VIIVDHGLPQIDQINGPSGRFYKTPEGLLFPSVTTILSHIPAPYLDEWRDRVGQVEADRVSKFASARGSFIHDCCERHVLGLPNKFSFLQMTERDMFNNLVPYINQFQEVHGIEARLFSNKLRSAGTVDVIVKIDGKMYIVDYKTSRGMKSRSDIPNYFMQCAFYAVAFFEMTGIVVPNIRILMTTPDNGVLVFDEKVKDWIQKFIDLRNSVI